MEEKSSFDTTIWKVSTSKVRRLEQTSTRRGIVGYPAKMGKIILSINRRLKDRFLLFTF